MSKTYVRSGVHVHYTTVHYVLYSKNIQRFVCAFDVNVWVCVPCMSVCFSSFFYVAVCHGISHIHREETTMRIEKLVISKKFLMILTCKKTEMGSYSLYFQITEVLLFIHTLYKNHTHRRSIRCIGSECVWMVFMRCARCLCVCVCLDDRRKFQCKCEFHYMLEEKCIDVDDDDDFKLTLIWGRCIDDLPRVSACKRFPKLHSTRIWPNMKSNNNNIIIACRHYHYSWEAPHDLRNSMQHM